MTDKVRIELKFNNELYGTTANFSKNLIYTKKQMILKALESFKEKLEKEIQEENQDG